MKKYSELIKYKTFEERFDYLRTNGSLSIINWENERYLNQVLYASSEWKKCRNQIIIRDEGCNLAIPGYFINGKIIVHHINSITSDMIYERDSQLFDFENLICVDFDTHNAIHFGNQNGRDYNILCAPIERKLNDTIPWK